MSQDSTNVEGKTDGGTLPETRYELWLKAFAGETGSMFLASFLSIARVSSVARPSRTRSVGVSGLEG